MTSAGTIAGTVPGTVGVVVPAAGAGVRFGGPTPKALALLAGEPLLVHAVRALRAAPSVAAVVVAAPAEHLDAVGLLLAAYDVLVVAGGPTRQDSVGLALAALPAEVDLVLVHDAARCLAPVSVIEQVIAALRGGAQAVVPAVPVVDTIKRVDDDGLVVATVDRAPLRIIQTPQGFSRALLERAHAAGLDPLTDDAGLVELLGAAVLTVPGSDEAFKLTRPQDLLLAEAVLAGRS